VTEPIKGKPSWTVHLSIMENLSKKEIFTDLLVQNLEEENFVRSLLEKGNIPSKWVRFHHIPHEDIWMRDMGPIFVKSFNSTKLKVVDFNFNDWGYSVISKDNKVDYQIAQKLGLGTISSSLFSEGGGWEVNGTGILMTTEAVQFQRNPKLSRQDIEKEYQRTLGIQKVIWIPRGLPEDQLSFRGQLPGGVYTAITTGGHVDEFARFVAKDTILLGEVSEEDAKKDPIVAMSREVLEEAYEILQKERDLEGKPFKIVRIPMPDPHVITMKKGDGTFNFLQKLKFEDGSVIKENDTIKVILASSYINFLVTNGLVLMPEYYRPGLPESTKKKDLQAKEVLQKLFPDREIRAIDVNIVNAGGGGIHCITQQMPKVP
jgi:agmatine deiminase